MSGGRPPGIQFDRLPTLWDSLLAEGEQFVGNGNWPKMLCPFHDDHRPSLAVQKNGNGYLCRVCGMSGSGVVMFYPMRDGVTPTMVAQRFDALEEDPMFRRYR